MGKNGYWAINEKLKSEIWIISKGYVGKGRESWNERKNYGYDWIKVIREWKETF